MIALSPADAPDFYATPSQRSLTALLGLNFLLAGILVGFGPFVAVYLAEHRWGQAQIGMVLTAGGLASLASQIPGGALLDSIAAKRLMAGLGIALLGLAAATIAVAPRFPYVLSAELMQGVTGGVVGPALAAVTLGLVGYRGMARQLGRNARFASAGGIAAAALLGMVGQLVSTRAIFVLTALLAIPALLALTRIRGDEVVPARARAATVPGHPGEVRRPMPASALWQDRRLLIFAGCEILFQLANASLLPLVGEELAYAGHQRSSLIMSAMIIGPQLIVVLLAPWVGRRAHRFGRRPLLLLSFGVLPLRALLFAATTSPPLLVAIQLMDGVSGAVAGVMAALVISDITAGSGRFNLAQGVYGTLMGIGASLSTTLSGFVVEHFGRAAGFLGLAGIALAGFALIAALMPETRPLPVPESAGQAPPPPLAKVS
ncbi:MAG: MFS transporter [Dongiaceae bacterium]